MMTFKKMLQLHSIGMTSRIRRTLGTSGVVALAFSGGPFGLSWLAATSSFAFLGLLLVIWTKADGSRH